MVTITSDLAWALGMVPDCLVPADDAPQFRDEFGGGWFWYRETYEEPKMARNVMTIRFHDEDDDCA